MRNASHVSKWLADKLCWVTKTTYFLAFISTSPKIFFLTGSIRALEIYLVNNQQGLRCTIHLIWYNIQNSNKMLPPFCLFHHLSFWCQTYMGVKKGVKKGGQGFENDQRGLYCFVTRHRWLRPNKFPKRYRDNFPQREQTCFLYKWAGVVVVVEGRGGQVMDKSAQSLLRFWNSGQSLSVIWYPG